MSGYRKKKKKDIVVGPAIARVLIYFLPLGFFLALSPLMAFTMPETLLQGFIVGIIRSLVGHSDELFRDCL